MSEFYIARSAVPKQEGKPHVMLCTPSLPGSLTGSHFAAVVKALPRLMNAGIAVDHFLLIGNCHVDDARNACVAHFLASDCTHLVFIDADVGFAPDGLSRLIEHDESVDLVAGIYPKKEQPRAYPWRFEGEVLHADEDGLIREGVLGVPTGFLRISRRVLERMAELRVDRMFNGGVGPLCPIIFERTYVKGNRISGDIAFCEWARELGFTIAADPFIQLSHEGAVRFIGCLAQDYAAPPEESEHTNGKAA